MHIELTAVEVVIANEIEQGATQTEIAETYALAMVSSWPTDWAKVNKAIIERWSVSGLTRIKTLAWKRVEKERERSRIKLKEEQPDD